MLSVGSDETKAKRAAWHAATREKRLAQMRVYNETNRVQLKARRQAAYTADPEKFNTQSRAYRAAHREQIREQKRTARLANLEQAKARDKAYLADNREQVNVRRRACHAARKARIYAGVCMDCGSTNRLEYDHRDPATKSFGIAPNLRARLTPVLQAEIQKCDLVCHDCHVIRTKSRRLAAAA